MYRVTSSPVDFSLRVSLSPSRRRWPRPSCDRSYTSQRLEDLLGRLVRASSTLSSLWAAIADGSHASRRASSASLRPLSPSVPIRTQTGHSRPSQFAPWGNILSPGAPDTPPQRIYRPGTHLDGSTESPRHPFSQSSSSPMFCSHRTHVMPLLPHCVARQYTSRRHMATLSSSEGCPRNMQQVGFVFRSALTAPQRELATAQIACADPTVDA